MIAVLRICWIQHRKKRNEVIILQIAFQFWLLKGILCKFSFRKNWIIRQLNFLSTSPSFYLSLVGTASVQDSCGQVSSVYTNTVIPVPIGGLSTISLDVPIGASFVNRAEYRGVNHDSNWTDFLSYTKQVRVEDLACLTWSLMKLEDKNGYATVGLPFFPIIHPPSEISTIDCAWDRCSDFTTLEREGNYRAYEIFDLLKELVPVSAIAPVMNPVTSVNSLNLSSTVISLPKANLVDTRSPELPSSTAKSLSSNIVKSYKEKPEQPSSGISEPASTGNLENLDPNELIYRSTHNSLTELKQDAFDLDMMRKSVKSYGPEAKSGMNADYFSALKGLRIPNTSFVGENKSSRLDADEDGLLTFPTQDFMAQLSNDVLVSVTIKTDETKIMGLKTLINIETGSKLLIDSSTAKTTNFLPSPVLSTHIGKVSSGNLLFLSIDSGTVSSNRPRTSMSAKPFTLEPTGTLHSRTEQISLLSDKKFCGGQEKMQAPKKQIICLGLVMEDTFFWL